VWMICTTHMFVEVYLYIQVAIIPVVVREFGLGLFEASLIATVPSIAGLLMNIPSGFLADRLSTNQLLFTSMIIEGVAALVVSQTNSFWMLVIGVSFMKAGSPIYHVAGLSQISRIVKPQQLSRSVGVHNAMGSLGSTAGLISLTIFLLTTGWRWTYLAWSFPILVWGIILLISSQLKLKQIRVRADPSQKKLSQLRFVLSPALLIFLAVIGIREIGATGFSTFTTTYFVNVRNLSDTTSSLIFAIGPAMGIIGSLLGGYLAERHGANKALSWVILSCSLLLGGLSLMTSVYLLALFYLVYAFVNNALWSPMNTILARITPESDRGLGYSFYFFTEGLMDSFSPTLAASVIVLSSVWGIFPFTLSLFIVSLIVLQFLPRFERREIGNVVSEHVSK